MVGKGSVLVVDGSTSMGSFRSGALGILGWNLKWDRARWGWDLGFLAIMCFGWHGFGWGWIGSVMGFRTFGFKVWLRVWI